jgi:alanyl-tRNA synthetase
MVAPDRLRFDFTHFSQVASKDLERIESIVNNRILENISVQIDEMDSEEAFKSGAIALFEEKYGERVRVISLNDFSKELCGGTHAERTGDIGLFKILGESSVASGVRRIEAVTGHAAITHVQHMSKIIQETARLVKEKPEDITQRVKKILSDMKSLEKEVDKLKIKAASKTTESIDDDIKKINDIHVLVKKVTIDSPAALRDLADKYKDKIKSGVVVLGSINGSKVMLIAVVTKDLTDRYHAGEIIKQVAKIAGGSGGGRPDMAQAGGSKPEKLDAALEKVQEIIAKR